MSVFRTVLITLWPIWPVKFSTPLGRGTKLAGSPSTPFVARFFFPIDLVHRLSAQPLLKQLTHFPHPPTARPRGRQPNREEGSQAVKRGIPSGVRCTMYIPGRPTLRSPVVRQHPLIPACGSLISLLTYGISVPALPHGATQLNLTSADKRWSATGNICNQRSILSCVKIALIHLVNSTHRQFLGPRAESDV